MKIPFKQIWNCKFKGISKVIYLESKAMEIVSLAIEKEVFAHKKEQKKCLLKKEDIKRLDMARQIIIENMVDPLTIEELSKKVVLNTYKLKVGFKELYGTTIFGYLRDIRMEKARILLEDVGKNINQIAQEVGYSNPSHFSAAFRKKYGMNPSELRHWG
jgi:AraC-like DNA-binding protein